ncbi:MAG: hypothetical protein HOP07_06070 [Bacteriovoracaceae bacterium]|nr:hypothetical protein [Bacteriovoracaceae bacterium]
MKKILKALILILCLIFIISCSTSTEEDQTVKKQHSEETNRAFSMIENNGSYRRKVEPNKKQSPIASPPIVKKVTIKKRKIQLPESVMIEINQNLAFYCMQHRKSKRFGGNEEKCMSYVNKTLEECQQKTESSHHKLLKCIKTGLKKRS